MTGRKAAGSVVSPTLKQTQGGKKKSRDASCGGKTPAAAEPWSAVAWRYPEQDDRLGFSMGSSNRRESCPGTVSPHIVFIDERPAQVN